MQHVHTQNTFITIAPFNDNDNNVVVRNRLLCQTLVSDLFQIRRKDECRYICLRWQDSQHSSFLPS